MALQLPLWNVFSKNKKYLDLLYYYRIKPLYLAANLRRFEILADWPHPQPSFTLADCFIGSHLYKAVTGREWGPRVSYFMNRALIRVILQRFWIKLRTIGFFMNWDTHIVWTDSQSPCQLHLRLKNKPVVFIFRLMCNGTGHIVILRSNEEMISHVNFLLVSIMLWCPNSVRFQQGI